MEGLENSKSLGRLLTTLLKRKLRRAPSIDGGENVLVDLAISNSYADLYRQCVSIAEKKGVDLPSEKWFLLQFWPCRRTTSNMVHYTRHFKVKRIAQNRILRKNNPDAHSTKAIQRFIMERAVANRETSIYVSADAIVQVRDSGFPLASVARSR